MIDDARAAVSSACRSRSCIRSPCTEFSQSWWRVADQDRIRIEIGFDGGQVMSAYVQTCGCGRRSSRRSAAPRAARAQIEAEDGRYTISLARVVYVKRYSREGRVGFSGG